MLYGVEHEWRQVAPLEITLHAAVPPWQTAITASGQAITYNRGSAGEVRGHSCSRASRPWRGLRSQVISVVWP
jgi:hypothetical protein